MKSSNLTQSSAAAAAAPTTTTTTCCTGSSSEANKSTGPLPSDGPYELPSKPMMAPSIQRKISTNANIVVPSSTGDKIGSNSIRFRKRLGSRRDESDMMTESMAEEEKEEEEEPQQNDVTSHPTKTDPATTTTMTTAPTPVERKLVFTSPRCIVKDDAIFPTNHSPYKKSDERWKQISDQAGSHRQDGATMTIGRKITPEALRIGMTKQAAGRVRCLNLWLDHDKDILPEWLDVIAPVFVNLEHLNLTEDVFPGEDEMAVSSRMRRLYILYRLPFLKSIDDVLVTSEERQIARPNDPNGNRVLKSEWVNSQNSLFDDEDDNNIACAENTDQQHQPIDDLDDDVGQIPTIPATMSDGGVKTAKERGVEINHELAAKVAELTRMSTIKTGESLGVATAMCDKLSASEATGPVVLSPVSADSPNSCSETSLSKCGGSSLKVTRIEIGDDIEVRHNQSLESQNSYYTPHGDAVEVDLTGRVKQRHYGLESKAVIATTSKCGNDEIIRGWERDCGSPPSKILSMVHDTSESSIELVSVASTDLEWSAACGVLAFRSDTACAARVRLPFCSQNRGMIAAAADNSVLVANNINNKLREKENATTCPSVPRQSEMMQKTPRQGGCCPGRTTNESSSHQSKFFPKGPDTSKAVCREKAIPGTTTTLSANKQLPPSKSLTSPFPMQFRDRRRAPPTTSSVVDTRSREPSSQTLQIVVDESLARPLETISSPLPPALTTSLSSPRSITHTLKIATKGDLPPPCPGGNRRKVAVMGSDRVKSRTSRRRLRQRKASKENARCTSVMDLEDDDEDDDDNNDDDDVDYSSDESSIDDCYRLEQEP